MSDAAASYRELDLGGTFRLTSPARPEIEVPITLPGDVHSALLAAGIIPDPYFGTNEMEVMWVNHVPWTIEGSFDVPPEMAAGRLTLTLSQVDTVATLVLNGDPIAELDNYFVRNDIDVTGRIRPGVNHLRVDFAVTRDVAKARAEAHPFPLPFTANYLTNGLEGVHLNFVRKPACHAGWDWGICLMPTGIYGPLRLRQSHIARLDAVQVLQSHRPGAVDLTIVGHLFAFSAGTVELTHAIAWQTVGGAVTVGPGENRITHTLTIDDPELWWPAGQGEQPLYELETGLDGEVEYRHIGLRDLQWVVEKDEIDHSFKCRINGRDITMMGANWIPADALPARIGEAGVADLLQSARDANMNMIRVWGGGQYEPDYFYEICDRLGLLVWQDFMFSCMSYPSDPAFLESVEQEATQQVRRLSHHASLALWCGDNEVIGSLSWYPETRANPERYVANYDRLNSMLAKIVAGQDPGRRFWPSSPSLGYLDFSDGWHSDTRGDLHYWDVWHSAKPFEAYRTVHPRFASEFGFQSFPAIKTIESFARREDFNPSSPVMEQHQRNEGGNARILETMCRYFRFPKDFETLVFLSQVQQALAIRTAVDYWRSTKPRCMGTLFWQLNDIYPVASWSSLNYGGSWKLLHYAAKRFYAPVSVVAVPKADTIAFTAVNDGPKAVRIMLTVEAVAMNGDARTLFTTACELPTDRAVDLGTIERAALGETEFLAFSWIGEDQDLRGESEFFPRAYKYYDLPAAAISARWDRDGEGTFVTLTTDAPAFFVTLETRRAGRFSDNGLALLPGRPKTLRFLPATGTAPGPEEMEKDTGIVHLAQTY